MVRRIFNLPRDTIVRSISSEFGLENTEVVYAHRKDHIDLRQARTGAVP
jgi:hypothetical protein